MSEILKELYGTKEQCAELLEAVKKVNKFFDLIPGGESYWIDMEGKFHDADMGYVNEFLIDLIEYLEKKMGE